MPRRTLALSVSRPPASASKTSSFSTQVSKTESVGDVPLVGGLHAEAALDRADLRVRRRAGLEAVDVERAEALAVGNDGDDPLREVDLRGDARAHRHAGDVAVLGGRGARGGRQETGEVVVDPGREDVGARAARQAQVLEEAEVEVEVRARVGGVERRVDAAVPLGECRRVEQAAGLVGVPVRAWRPGSSDELAHRAERDGRAVPARDEPGGALAVRRLEEIAEAGELSGRSASSRGRR